MPRNRRLQIFSCFAGLIPLIHPWIPADAQAQSTLIEPEIRRALPVENGTPLSETASTPPPVRIMKALPAVDSHSPPAPSQTPSPNPTSAPPTPATTPIDASARITPANDPSDTIRIAPSGAQDSESQAASQLAVADAFFERKQPESAVPEYEKFLVISSKSTPGRDRALFRLGESQRLMGSDVASEASFQRLVEESPYGMFTPAASFRLGELRESRGYLDGAASSFELAAKQGTDPSIRNTATYRQALCLEKSNQREAAVALFKTLVQSPVDNPSRIPALIRLGADATDAGRKEEALGWYQQVLQSGAKGEVFSEAAIQTAVLQSELGNEAEAKKLFDQVAASRDSGRWKYVAALGSLRLASRDGNTTDVLKISPIALGGDAENKPEILLLQANALRKIGKNAQALENYESIIREYPGSKAASLAPFQRLLVLHALHSDSLSAEIDNYLITASDPSDRARAQLLKAEDTLARGKYRDAAALYHSINATSLPSSSAADILYKEAWALTRAGDKKNAEDALTRFLQAYPDEQRSPGALAQRALLKQQDNDLAGSLADFTQLDERYPKAAERELALQQKALLLGQQQDNKGMVEAFSRLLTEFPKSQSAPQAHYWIGWAAMENKDYTTAATELSAARTGDPKQFGERAGLRILLADYYLNHPEDAAREANALKASLLPPEVARWLGLKALESGAPAKAEHFLAPLVKEGLPGASDTEVQVALASAFVAEGKFREAQSPAGVCLKLARDPASRAQALLVSADIQRSLNNLPQAFSMTEEAMLLQPEGAINAQARILSGELLMARHDYASAAKAFITVGVLYEDPVLTPKALTKAVVAFRRAGNLIEAQKTLDELRRRYPNAPVPPDTES